MDGVILVLTQLPDRASAEHMARALVESGAAACVSIQAECASVYRWKGTLEITREVPLLIKTTQAGYPRLEAAIRALHSYELPEIVAVSVIAGLPGYLGWVKENTEK